MGKISLVSTKYIVHAHIEIEGVVERPDVIGSIFGQTEGLLGSELELRELQRSGRIGRIEVDLETRSGKTKGMINIPSSMDKTETALIAAALETIQRIGPCNAAVKVEKLEDIRISKRNQVIHRAKELLSNLTYGVLPDTKDIKDEVADSVRVMEATEYGKDRLAAGPTIDESEEVIVVEGRADVLNLLKHDIKNSIAMNGTSVPDTIIELSKRKTITLFVDGDRGGDLIIKGLKGVASIDYVSKAPAGKEVEELTQKEIHQALRRKISFEQAVHDVSGRRESAYTPQARTRKTFERRAPAPQTTRGGFRERRETRKPRETTPERTPYRTRKPALSKEESKNFKNMLNDLIGTKGAYLLDKNAKIMGKVPATELQSTIDGLDQDTYAVVLDGNITKDMVSIAEKARIKFLVAADAEAMLRSMRVKIITNKDL